MLVFETLKNKNSDFLNGNRCFCWQLYGILLGFRSARNKNVPHISVFPFSAQTTTTHPGSHVMREAKIRLKSMSLESPADSIIA